VSGRKKVIILITEDSIRALNEREDAKKNCSLERLSLKRKEKTFSFQKI